MLAQHTHTYKVGVLAQWAARGQKTVRKSPPAPFPQTKASEKELGGFFGRFLPSCCPQCPEPRLYVCVCAVPELSLCAVPELRVCAVPELRHERCARTVYVTQQQSEKAGPSSVNNMRGCALHLYIQNCATKFSYWRSARSVHTAPAWLHVGFLKRSKACLQSFERGF